ncbi:MAG: hypothetical protein K2J13_02410, partial [Clostridia bacterium]|nr:hypothetical protein [Clostridia bacterium]
YISENAFKEVVEGQISSTISSVGTKEKGSLSFSVSNNYRSISFNAIAKSEDLSKFEVMWFGGAKDTLADDEFVISLDSARDYRLFDYNDGEKVEESEIVIDFNKQYFGGIVRANITQLSDLSTNSMRNAIVAFCEAADALTDEQAEEFRAYVKGIGEKSNTNIMDRYIQDMIYEARNCTYYDFVLNLGDIYDKNIDTMTLDELRFLYAGYLHTYGSTYDVGGVTLEIKGGDTYNAIGLDCGRVVQDYYGKKVYYTELFKAVSYVPFAMNNVNYYFQNGPSYWDNTDGKIVGVYVNKRVVDEDGYLSYYNSDTFIFNDILYSRAESIEPTVYSFFIAPMPKDRAQI